MMISANKMVAAGLGRSIRAVWREGRFLRERGSPWIESAVDLIGGDVKKTKCRLPRFRQFAPKRPHGLKQSEGSSNVGLDEGFWIVDRAVHVRLRGKVHHSAYRVHFKQPLDQWLVGDIPNDKEM